MYQVKIGPETLWAIAVAVITALAQITQGAPPDDWRVWAVAAAAAVVRAVGGVILSMFPPAPPSGP